MNHIIAGLGAIAVALTGSVQVAAAAPAKNVVLVHGAFVDQSSWDKAAELPRAKGYPVTAVANPLTSLADDVAATRKVIAAQNGPTVLVGHSWGGVVIGEAGDDPKVSSLVYVAAFAPDRGESVQSLAEGKPPSDGQKAVRPNAHGMLIVDPTVFPGVFAGDLPAEQGRELAAHQLPVAASAFGDKAQVAAWHDKPTFYAVSANDRMLAPDAERFFAQRMKAQVVTLQSSHASPVTHPAEVAALIERAAQSQ